MKMFKQKLQKYLTQRNSLKVNSQFQYVNNYTAELTNTPWVDTLYTILYTDIPLKCKVAYMFSWRKFHS